LRQKTGATVTLPGSDATLPGRPLLRVVRGNPTPEELAALIAVVRARGGEVEAPAPHRSLWGRPALRQPLHTGPGAWRASTLPR
jgi:hypothetical protein